MSVEQPEASTSTSTAKSPNLGTFVFVASLTREAFVKLIEPNGAIHQLVQRLMEKHGGEDNVSYTLSSPSPDFKSSRGEPVQTSKTCPSIHDHSESKCS